MTYYMERKIQNSGKSLYYVFWIMLLLISSCQTQKGTKNSDLEILDLTEFSEGREVMVLQNDGKTHMLHFFKSGIPETEVTFAVTTTQSEIVIKGKFRGDSIRWEDDENLFIRKQLGAASGSDNGYQLVKKNITNGKEVIIKSINNESKKY